MLEPFENKDTFVGYRVFHVDIDREEQMALPMVRHMDPLSTNSEEDRVQRELSIKI
jgi:hypothetical protein